ncbi:MAG: hypothetical protein LC808_36130 [Actinobacteria bacterium]|nr:hypothetical protein [Actinomycetota bacterium]
MRTTDIRSDGDTHLELSPDEGYERFLDRGNKGALVVEVVPGQHFPEFEVGDHLKIFGSWVFDTHNDWNEFHPVWSIEFLDEGRRYDVLPPVTPLYDGNADD